MNYTIARRALGVRRFHTQPRITEETVGHHTAGVLLALLYLEPDASREVLLAAISHDLGEYVTGDMPSPAKANLSRDAHIELKTLELAATRTMGVPRTRLTQQEKKLLKLADLLDLAFSSFMEVEMGNRPARMVIRNVAEYIADGDFPQHHLTLINKLEIFNHDF